MSQRGFGFVLHDERVRQGLEVNAVARRLRIRPDVIEAFEHEDFDHMPPRGYARNMVNAYAHLLGLNPTEITKMYLDEVYAHQVGEARRADAALHFDMGGPDRRTAANRLRAQARKAHEEDARDRKHRIRHDETTRRQVFTDDAVDSVPKRIHSRNITHRSTHSVAPDRQYVNFYAGPENPRAGLRRKIIPIILVVAAIVAIIAIVMSLAAARAASSSDVPNLPVSGAAAASSSSQPAAATPPTKFTFTYTVASGSSSWIEVYIDGVAQEAETVQGPASRSFDCSSELEFICSGVDGVSATQDGTALTLTPDDGGIVDMTIKFSDVLSAWQQAHPSSGSSSSSKTSGA